MPIFVALLRGINVGEAKRLPMEALRQLLAELGYAGVKTLLNSGNAVFHAAGTSGATHAESIGQAISETLALEVPVIVKSAHQFDAIVREYPFGPVDSDHSRHIVAFTQEKHSLSTLRSIEALVNPPEIFVVGKHAAYLHCANGILGSKAGEALLGKLGKAATTRNWATTLKLHALVTRSDA